MTMSDKQKTAKTHKGRMHLGLSEAKIFELPKECLFINTSDSSEIMRMVLSDLHLMRKYYSKKLSKKNENINLFKDTSSIEFLNERNNTALFVYTQDKKKREMDITFG